MTPDRLVEVLACFRASDLRGGVACLDSTLGAVDPAGSTNDIGTETLLLHLRALARFGLGERDGAAADLTRASELEREAGWTTSAAHTVHQWALLAPDGGSLSKSKRYYSESLSHLRGAHNWLGAGLCIRSLGELAVVTGHADQAVALWSAGVKSLAKVGAPEKHQLEAWVTLLSSDTLSSA